MCTTVTGSLPCAFILKSWNGGTHIWLVYDVCYPVQGVRVDLVFFFICHTSPFVRSEFHLSVIMFADESVAVWLTLSLVPVGHTHTLITLCHLFYELDPVWCLTGGNNTVLESVLSLDSSVRLSKGISCFFLFVLLTHKVYSEKTKIKCMLI